MSSRESFRQIVRILETDVDGELPLVYGLSEVKGLGYAFSLAVCRVLGLDPRQRTGFLSDDTVKSIEEVVRNPGKYGIPAWIYNRRKDYATGQDLHLTSANLIYYVKEDIEREKRIKSWRGIRHALGLKVRGQRTRTTGRTGVTVGVRKKKAAQQPQGKKEQG
ncbi:30S ribosomal protein S13 [Desulfurococcus mucosus]|uniref:Small ribosomal subunit protein uS13 n=1 Tax=Desulfurococcus mucosus (strain ATCC 35584 / DSM 2162 / JCM 9187 / O7/1) TaxID=765177 RepID=E8R7Q7_DESM0|nr:30S ribosomal protein S13 [Desulfurococcus mucosus]ADV65651.1 SSU ribosomal protein S13P [Desulfurococcus mucosus DSM 2162]